MNLITNPASIYQGSHTQMYRVKITSIATNTGKMRTWTRVPMGTTHVRVCAVHPPFVSMVGPLQVWSHYGHEKVGGQCGCRRGQCPLGPVFAALFPCVKV